jgi:hypothetical protein
MRRHIAGCEGIQLVESDEPTAKKSVRRHLWLDYTGAGHA